MTSESTQAPKSKKPYRPPRVRSESVLVPDFFATNPQCGPNCEDFSPLPSSGA